MFFWRRRKTDKEEEEIIWEGKYFSEVKKNGEGKGEKYRVFFFNWNVAGLALPTCLGCPTPTPLNLWSMKITFRSSDTSTFFQSWGPVWDSNVFWSQLLTGQHLANSGGGQLKKPPCIYAELIMVRWKEVQKYQGPPTFLAVVFW